MIRGPAGVGPPVVDVVGQARHLGLGLRRQARPSLVQSEAPKVSPPDLSQSVANILGALDQIARLGNKGPANLASEDFEQIDRWKLEALRDLRILSRKTGAPYPIPEYLTDEVFFSREEADGPPTV